MTEHSQSQWPLEQAKDLPKIKRIEILSFLYPVINAARGEVNGKLFYAKGASTKLHGFAIRITAEDGSVGNYVPHMGGRPTVLSQSLNLARALLGEPIGTGARFQDFSKKQLQTLGGLGTGPLEICLWDLLGKYLNISVGTLIGQTRTSLPAYASLIHGNSSGDLQSHDDLSDAVKACRDAGFRGVKFRGWPGSNADGYKRAIETVATALPDRGAVNLFLDPGCDLRTFADALAVGRASDDAGLFWLEDVMRDSGQSVEAHKRLKSLIRTPLLCGEHVRGLEAKTVWMTSGATDFIRAEPELDGGLMACLKIAHLAEAFGMDVEIHGSGPVHRLLMASLRNTNFYELGLVMPDGTNIHAPDIYACGYSDGFDALDANGEVSVPQGPGLGVVYDWEKIEQLATERHVFE